MNILRFTTGAGLSLIAISSTVANAELVYDVGLTDSIIAESYIPEVLTATRLKQPRAEVPGSVTVISAEQINAWGVRTVPELLRFVPGMFVKHGSQDSVAYHASSSSLMRRMQVLIDGRSIYRSGVASVVWEDLPVALEDIQRIEVVRGPNAASYGANAFMAVINIVTFHPADTLGTRAYVRRGHQSIRDYHLSYSDIDVGGAYRITGHISEDDGFDGRNAQGGKDIYYDGSRNSFVNGTYNRLFNGDIHWLLEGGYSKSEIQLPANGTSIEEREDLNQSGFVFNRLTKDFSTEHSAHLQAYWQVENHQVPINGCVPTIGLDEDLYNLYDVNPLWANVIGRTIAGAYHEKDENPEEYILASGLANGVAAGVVSPEYVEFVLEDALGRDYTINQSDLDAGQAILLKAFNGTDLGLLGEVVCGQSNADLREQRFDIEWQDTMYWSDTLHTVSGISYRRDQVRSETFFKGTIYNDILRVFTNAEWHIFDDLILNAGGMYENEDSNNSAFSPRIALNYMLGQQHSVRLVYSQAVRSPDLLEQQPDYSYQITSLTENFLGLEAGEFFQHQNQERNLDHEKITSIELGYYINIPIYNLTYDIKVYRDHLYQLISNPINLSTVEVNSDTVMNIKGIDWQFSWSPIHSHSFWWSGAYVDTDVSLGDVALLTQKEINNLQSVETRLSAELSNNLSWTFSPGNWQVTQSYFWHDAYNRDQSQQNHYRRYEMNWQKTWPISSTNLVTDIFWHHLIDNGSISYADERYSVDDIIYIQAGIEF